MMRIIRIGLLIVLGACLLAIVSSGKRAVAATEVSDMGLAQISGPIQLDVILSPTAVQPGELIQLTVSVANLGQATQLPEITFQLPPSLSLDSMLLPQGMTVNLAANEMKWLPVVPANGGQLQFTMPLKAGTADVAHPEQAVTAVIHVDGSEFTAQAGFWLGIPPQIGNISAPSQIAVGQPIQLRVEPVGSGPFTQSWQLGDGRQVDVSDPPVVYPMAGIYQVEVTVENPVGAATGEQMVSVVPHPAAQFTANDFSVTANMPIAFINQSGGQPPLSYEWVFGDGTTSTEVNPVHQFAAPGVYQVQMVVENEYGRSEAIWQVTVGEPPTADVIIPESIAAGESFSAQALGDDSITRFSWFMGDGSSYEGSQITHSYRQSGDHYVILSANNEFGGTDVGRWIHVDAGLFSYYLPAILNALTGQTVASDPLVESDGLGIQLPDVELDETFVLQPLDLPNNLTQAEQLFIYINEARSQFDLQPLTMISTLNSASQQHTDDMAQFSYTSHTGSDGSTPAERFIWHQYNAGYAGEATAWGFEHPYQAVEFWVNSPAHRRIILNEFATDVGVGYTVNYAAANVWYWTAEFGNQYGAASMAQLRMHSPDGGVDVLNSDLLTFSWNWPLPLIENQSFELELITEDESILLAAVAQPSWGTYYQVETDLLSYPTAIGNVNWQVKLVQGVTTQQTGEQRQLIVLPDPTIPTATPEQLTPEPATPTPIPTATATPTSSRPASTRAVIPPPPPLITATPQQ
ncbi:MAG: PKD domain-containing protein [Chloroflexi bacterium]|nr:MAG: PKD domain-containing protein [Chloroflexota bacterium]